VTTGNVATINVMANTTAVQEAAVKTRGLLLAHQAEVNLLILITTSTGYYLASHGPLRIGGLVNTLIGTLLAASGTATLNQWMERLWTVRCAELHLVATFGQGLKPRGAEVRDSPERGQEDFICC